MTYTEAVKFLNSFTNYERMPRPQSMRRMKLDRMRRLCALLGDPQRGFRSILVAGTNAKGSICAMLYAMLQCSSFRVGLYTSPHLEHVRERIRVWPVREGTAAQASGADWISEAEFADAAACMEQAVSVMRRGPHKEIPTYFEVLTAMAFVHFKRRGVDCAVLEVGLGGRLDATNVVEQAVSVIGPLSLDHTAVLGSDVLSIAREKCGIIKPGQSVISAAQPEDVAQVLRVTCEAHGVPLAVCGQAFSAAVGEHDLEGLTLDIHGLRATYPGILLPLIGRHQAENAAAAVAALEALADTGAPHALVAQGLSRVSWPGRIEVAQESPMVILDGAHNPQAAGALAQTLRELLAGRRIHMLLGMSADKDTQALARILGPLASSITCTQSRHPRALDPALLAERVRPYCSDVHVIADCADASTYVLNAIEPDDALLITGTFFLVGALRSSFTQARTRRAAVSV